METEAKDLIMSVSMQEIKTIMTNLRTYGYQRWEPEKGIHLKTLQLVVKIMGWLYCANSSKTDPKLTRATQANVCRMYFLNETGLTYKFLDAYLLTPGSTFDKVSGDVGLLPDGTMFVEQINNVSNSFRVTYEKQNDDWYSISCYDANAAAAEEDPKWRPKNFSPKLLDYLKLPLTKENIEQSEILLNTYIALQMKELSVSVHSSIFGNPGQGVPPMDDFFGRNAGFGNPNFYNPNVQSPEASVLDPIPADNPFSTKSTRDPYSFKK